MSKKLIGAALGALILAVAAPLLTLALLHGVGGTAHAQPPSFTKVSVPDLGQHSTGWCWVGAAANSFWWYAHNTAGQDSLLGGVGHPWELIDGASTPPGGACGTIAPLRTWLDSRDAIDGSIIPGYATVLKMIAQTTFKDANQNGNQDGVEDNYCYGEGVEEWDYLVGLSKYVNSYGSGLKVHSIIDPQRCLPGNYGMKPDDRVKPPAFNALAPCGLDFVADPEPGLFDQAPGPPTFLDYKTELSGGQDVLLWMETYGSELETAHVVTGVGYAAGGAFGLGTVTISDPWTHLTNAAGPPVLSAWHTDFPPPPPPPPPVLWEPKPDHNTSPNHAPLPLPITDPYNLCDVTQQAPLKIQCYNQDTGAARIWSVVDMIFVSPTGADIKVLTFYSEPEPPFEFVVSENNVINLVEDKHNNGPEPAWVDVSWTVDPIPDLNHDGIPDINVRWEAVVGDRCTSGGQPVACGEGDGPGTGGSADGNPSLTGDNCQDGMDNDNDQLTDFADPDCLWELDDLHFQIWMAVSTSTAVNRDLKMHCKVPGDYTVTLRNNEMPVEVEDPDPSNNSRTLDLPITCTAEADVKIHSQQILAANCQDPPPTDIDVSVGKDICVQKVLHNNGPYGPVSVNIVKTAKAPPGCTIDPVNPTAQVVLQQSVTMVHQEWFTIHCDEASTHGPFTIDNTISIKDPGVTDPNTTNNVASSTLTVIAFGHADIKITSQSFLNPPSQMTVGVPVVVTLRKTLHNNGPYTPVTVNIVKTAYTNSQNATIAPPTASAQVELVESSTVTHDEVFTISCSAPGTYTYTVDNNVWPKDAHIIDSNGAFASTDLIVECVEGAGQADVKVLDFWADPPYQFIPEPYVWWEPIPVWEVKHNNGPDATVADVDWWVTGGWPQSPVDVRWMWQPGDTCTFQHMPVECPTGGPNGDIDDLHFQVQLPVSMQVQLMRGIQFECKEMGIFVLTLWNQELPVAPIEDPDTSNNLQRTDVTVYCGVSPLQADKQVMGVATDISASDRNTTDSDLDIWTSTNVPINVGSLDWNMGQEATNSTITFLANVPVGCEGRWLAQTGDTLHEYERYDPSYPISQIHGYLHRDAKVPGDGDPMYPPYFSAESALHFQAEEHVGLPPSEYWRNFELHCWVDGVHTFTFCNKAEVMAPNSDPNLANNWQCQNLQVTSADCSSTVDSDGDTFNDNIECYLPTDQVDPCPDVIGADDAWPLDINMDKYVTMADVFKYSGRLNETGGPPPSAKWLKRLDLNKDNWITMADVFKYNGKLNQMCT